MVSGHLREKKGHFYAVLNYTDSLGKRKTKWIATGLAVKGNKKKAEAFLQEQRRNFQEEPITGAILFSDFMEQWLAVVKSSIAVTTYASYSNIVKRVIAPYFRERNITLQELTAKHIQDLSKTGFCSFRMSKERTVVCADARTSKNTPNMFALMKWEILLNQTMFQNNFQGCLNLMGCAE